MLQDPTPLNLGELAWRIGLPLSALILALLAIPLSFVNPRAGRSLNLVMAILIYMIYNNVISISQAWIAQQRMSLPVGVLAVHAAMLALLLLLFARRLTLFSVLTRFLKMKIIRRYLSAEITTSTALVFAALLMLLALFDLIHELGELGKGGYRLLHIFAYVLLSVPGHVYELFPIAALIGTLFAIAQLVANSEHTLVMRVSGVSMPRMALYAGPGRLALFSADFRHWRIHRAAGRAVRAAAAGQSDHRRDRAGVPLGPVGQGRA